MVSVQEIASFLENYFPKKLSYDWDNVGLQVGSFSAKVDSVLICVDVTEDVLNEAKELGVRLIISHHPLIFQGLKSIKDDTPEGRLIIDAIKSDIAILSFHTNTDVSKHGINFYLAKLLDLENVEGLSVKQKSGYFKIVVYVPSDYKDEVLEAMAQEGAGFIGKYSHCFFAVEGQGHFKPHEGANPFIGKIGELEKVKEVRLESIVSEDKLKNVIKAMLKAHPYEEVAYDIYRLENEISYECIGVIGGKNIEAENLIQELKEKLYLSFVKASLVKNQFKKIAIVSGSGKDFIKDAYFKGADCLISGEIGHHGVLLARSLGISTIEIGHYESEKAFVDIVFDLFDKFEKKNKLKIYKSQVNTSYTKIY
ncbi:Nif3-like dinuclear metal center hexameric protein [Caldicellulosiruptor naganoensis]|uniref:GTP cyclohydrolase 1 type 2 homolog n=1 Tax=Caldicellulosiruptor naganoensis TaxID=29324 RepID=A0ABY7BD91_9FIRM|nr:Nif3-like dinuclear metal center hexameric protein [Caldicellulosiruptor naganoensis]WAM30792.1 Nif3-like dinuclear metal center hexameric protein [Caldicellulosiruptor naganoensis]